MSIFRSDRCFPDPDTRTSLRLGFLLTSLWIVTTSGMPQDAPSGAEPAPAKPPIALEGIDLLKPAQQAFRSWPPASLLERPYWLPWSRYTLQRAKVLDRPIVFLMTVSWNRFAQRMEEEALADPGVLRAINEAYLGVAVSADRRPDLRERYQSGSWPVIAFLLPNGRPMLSQANPAGITAPIQMGYLEADRLRFFLEEGRIYYEKWRTTLHEAGNTWTKTEAESDPMPGVVKEEASDQVARWLLGNLDRKDGGFGVAPKFVVHSLAEYAAVREARGVATLSEPARLTLDKIVASPLYDRRDGGLHRLSAAMDWGQIQYEKMLESNSEILRDLVFSVRQADSPSLRAALAGTARFIVGVLARPGGGFYLGQCADPTTKDGGGYWTTSSPESAKPPPLDPLVLSGPNAMTGAALLRAGAMLGDESLEKAGRDALDLVLRAAYRPARGVDHVIEPNPEDRRFLTAQADVAFALLDAYESTGIARYRDAARDIVQFALNNLLVPGETALRDFLPEQGSLGMLADARRPLEPNIRLARAMVRLAAHGVGAGYKERSASIVASYSGDLAVYRVHGIEAALAVEELIREPILLRVEGPPDDPRTKALRRAALDGPAAWTVVTTAEGKEAPGVVISCGNVESHVAQPADLAAELKRVLSRVGRGTP